VFPQDLMIRRLKTLLDAGLFAPPRSFALAAASAGRIGGVGAVARARRGQRALSEWSQRLARALGPDSANGRVARAAAAEDRPVDDDGRTDLPAPLLPPPSAAGESAVVGAGKRMFQSSGQTQYVSMLEADSLDLHADVWAGKLSREAYNSLVTGRLLPGASGGRSSSADTAVEGTVPAAHTVAAYAEYLAHVTAWGAGQGVGNNAPADAEAAVAAAATEAQRGGVSRSGNGLRLPASLQDSLLRGTGEQHLQKAAPPATSVAPPAAAPPAAAAAPEEAESEEEESEDVAPAKHEADEDIYASLLAGLAATGAGDSAGAGVDAATGVSPPEALLVYQPWSVASCGPVGPAEAVFRALPPPQKAEVFAALRRYLQTFRPPPLPSRGGTSALDASAASINGEPGSRVRLLAHGLPFGLMTFSFRLAPRDAFKRRRHAPVDGGAVRTDQGYPADRDQESEGQENEDAEAPSSLDDYRLFRRNASVVNTRWIHARSQWMPAPSSARQKANRGGQPAEPRASCLAPFYLVSPAMAKLLTKNAFPMHRPLARLLWDTARDGRFALYSAEILMSPRLADGLALDPAGREAVAGKMMPLSASSHEAYTSASNELLIPKILHFIWLGTKAVSPEARYYLRKWQQLHPGWKIMLWTDQTAPFPLVNQKRFEQAPVFAQKADVLRYEIVRSYGGIYADLDFEPLRSLEPLLKGITGFVSYESEQFICNGIFGAVPNHPLIESLVVDLDSNWEKFKDGTVNQQTGPHYITAYVKDGGYLRDKTFRAFSNHVFFPYLWNEADPGAPYDDVHFAVHHFQKSGGWQDEMRALKQKKAAKK
jgi:mannosyltransferase OCH1-like enzyme